MRTLDELQEVSGDLTDATELAGFLDNDWAARSERGMEVFSYENGLAVLEHQQLLKGPSFQYRLDQLGIQGEARRYVDMGITSTEGELRRRMRAPLGALFRPTQIAKLRAAIKQIAHDALDTVEDPSAVDLMKVLCWEVPARTYCELVSIPHTEAPTVIRIADSVLGTLLTVDTTRRVEAEEAILESVEICRTHLDARRSNLGDDFTSVMIRQQEQGMLSEDELLAESLGILQASVDNTAHQMGNLFGSLLSVPDRWDAFIADRDLRGAMIEEAIRLYPRFGTVFRLASGEVEVGDVRIPDGTWVFVSARAGQRDPSVFDSPDEYRLDREARRPLMFGAGPYNCLGQGLARMEIEEGMLAIADRFPKIRLEGEWGRRQVNAVSETTQLNVKLVA